MNEFRCIEVPAHFVESKNLESNLLFLELVENAQMNYPDPYGHFSYYENSVLVDSSQRGAFDCAR